MLSVAEITFSVTKIGNFINIKVGKHGNNCRLAILPTPKLSTGFRTKLYIPDFPDDDNGGITLSHPIVNMMGQLLIKTNKIYY